MWRLLKAWGFRRRVPRTRGEPLEVPAEVAAAIRSAIAGYLRETNPGTANLRRAASELGALPIHHDMGGSTFLRPNGDCLSLGHDEPASTATPELTLRTTALVIGSETYPELRALLPARGPGDIDCPECGGTGRWPFDRPWPGRRTLCAKCDALGFRAPG